MVPLHWSLFLVLNDKIESIPDSMLLVDSVHKMVDVTVSDYYVIDEN